MDDHKSVKLQPSLPPKPPVMTSYGKAMTKVVEIKQQRLELMKSNKASNSQQSLEYISTQEYASKASEQAARNAETKRQADNEADEVRIDQGPQRYIGQKQSPEVSARSGLQLPRGVRQLRGSGHKIATQHDWVKHLRIRLSALSRRCALSGWFGSVKHQMTLLYFLCASSLALPAFAQQCHTSSIISPSPFMGNDSEVFQLADGSVWEVVSEYEYLYEYYPEVTVCPDLGKVVVAGKSLSVTKRSSPSEQIQGGQEQFPKVTITIRGCDHFLADGPRGIYLLEWYGGLMPVEGDVILGDIGSYGFSDVYYPLHDADGRVWVDDYLLSQTTAAQKILERCD